MEFIDRRLLVEGWRGVNHSYALINQHQLLEMSSRPGLELFHNDLPFALAHWSTCRNDAGFSAENRRRLEGLRAPDPARDRIDGVYRICSPFRSGLGRTYPDCRTTTFMITELGLSPDSFAPGEDRSAFFTREDNVIVTSTGWSRDRIIDYGFDGHRVHTVPLGVDAGLFRAPWPNERARHRTALGIGDDETVFLNIGPPLWNKGIDLLLQAFAALRLRGLKVRVLIKDQQDVYGIGLDGVLQALGDSCPALRLESVRAGITAIPMNLSPAQLATLFGLSDCYVSPYRAEGFNLPALEAIACALPTIVTQGGATDDFCSDDTSLRIPGRFHRKASDAGLVGAYVEPDLDGLTSAMAMICNGWRPDRSRFERARTMVLERFSWREAAQQTLRLSLP